MIRRLSNFSQILFCEHTLLLIFENTFEVDLSPIHVTSMDSAHSKTLSGHDTVIFSGGGLHVVDKSDEVQQMASSG